MIKQIIIAVLVLLTNACAPNTVDFKNINLTPAQAELFKQAINDWGSEARFDDDATNSVKIASKEDFEDHNIEYSEDTTQLGWQYGHRISQGPCSKIFLSPFIENEKMLKNTMLHELGHHFRLANDFPKLPENVMYENSTQHLINGNMMAPYSNEWPEALTNLDFDFAGM